MYRPVAVKHNIKRIDRLLGNAALHTEASPGVESAVSRGNHHAADCHRLVRFNARSPLAIAARLGGHRRPQYDSLRAGTSTVTGRFAACAQGVSQTVSAMLPPGCIPFLITDAGFPGPWFRLVNRMCWYWVGRIRNTDMVNSSNDDIWAGCKTLYPLATSQAQSLGQYNYVCSPPVPHRAVLLLIACLASFVLRMIGEVETLLNGCGLITLRCSFEGRPQNPSPFWCRAGIRPQLPAGGSASNAGRLFDQ